MPKLSLQRVSVVKRSLEELQVLIEKVPSIIQSVSPEGRFLYVNDAWKKALGYSGDELKTLKLWDVITKEHRARCRKLFRLLLKGQSVHDIETEFVTKNGRTLTVAGHMLPLIQNGRVVAADGVFKDTTYNKSLENTLKRNDEKYHHLLDGVNEGIWIIDADGRTTFANRRVAKMLGYSVKEMLGRHLFSFMDRQGAKLARKKLERRKRDTEKQHEFKFRKKDGSKISVLLETSPILDENGNYAGALASLIDMTERKQSKETLRETNEYLTNLFNYANTPIIAWDTQLRIIRFSRAFESLTGRCAADTIGKPVKILFPPAIVEKSMKLIKKTSGGERWTIVELDIQHLDGSIRAVLWNSSPIFAPDGKTQVATVAQGQDITERKKAEEALKESEERFKALFDCSNDGILGADIKTKKFMFANPKICKLTGYNIKELLRLSVTDIHSKKELPYVIGQFEKQAKREIELAKDIPVKRKDGGIFYADVNSFPVHIGGKKYLVGMFRDTTERRKAEESLRENEEKWRSLVENAPNIIIIADRDGTIRFINHTVSGLTVNNTIGTKLYDYAPNEYHDIMRKTVERVFETGGTSGYEIKGEGPNGNTSWYMTQAGPIIHEGKVVAVTLITTDITDKKHMEERIKTRSEELARANEELRTLDKAKTNFLNLISHELKTPLTAALAHLEILNDYKPKLDEQGALSLDAVKRNEDQLRILINNILEISRIESGTFELNYSHINISDAINEVINNLRILSDQKGLILRSETHGIPTIHADPDRIKTILTNLIGNAIKFTENGCVTVRGSVKNGFVEVHVIDTGVGISDEKQRRLFEKFYQVDPAIGRRYGGTGLGLTITKQLVELHGGKMSVKSKAGKGSDFWFTIPTKIPHDIAKEVKK